MPLFALGGTTYGMGEETTPLSTLVPKLWYVGFG